MSIEKENCWRYESNVKILDINLNFIGINIYKCYTCKFGYLPSRFRKLHWEEQIEFIHFIIFRINKNSKRERERERSGIQRRYVEGRQDQKHGQSGGQGPCQWCLWWLCPPLVSLSALSIGNYSFSPLQDFGARLLYCHFFSGQRLIKKKKKL